MSAPPQKSKSLAAVPKAGAGKKKTVQPKAVLVIEDDILIPETNVEVNSDSEADRSISVYPATVTSIIQEIRAPTPGISEIRENLKVNYDDFGFRLEERLRECLKSLVHTIERKERQSAELDQEIATRKRLLTAAQTTDFPGDSDFLLTQVKARDRQIAILSERMFDLMIRGKTKAGEEGKGREKVISALQMEVEALESAKKQLSEALAECKEREKARIASVEGERERISRTVDTAEREKEAAKLALEQRERALGVEREELTKANRLAADLIEKNKALALELQKIVAESDRQKAEIFDLRANLATVDSLRSEVSALKTNKAMYERQFEKMLQVTSNAEAERGRMKTNEGTMRKEIAKTLEFLTTSREVLAELEGGNRDLMGVLRADMEERRIELESLSKGVTNTDQSEAGSDVISRGKEKSAKIEAVFELNTLKQTVSSLETTKSLYESRAKSLEAEIAVLHSSEIASAIAKDSEGKQTSEQIDSMRRQISRLMDQLAEKEAVCNRANGVISGFSQKLEGQKSAQEGQAARIKVLERQVKTATEQIALFHKQSVASQKEIAYREKTAKDSAQKLKVMEVELWNKDSELLQKEAMIVSLQQEIASLRVEIDNFSVRLRTAVAEELSEVNRLLEDKSSQVELLKGMLRSSQTQVKQKDADILRYKRKTVVDPTSPGRSPKNVYSSEVRETVDSFCGQMERLRKFALAKTEKISAAEAAGTLSSNWLKEELKLAKPPADSIAPREVLRLSVEQRASGLIAQLQSYCEVATVSAEELVKLIPELCGEQFPSLSDALKKYTERTLPSFVTAGDK